MKIVLLDNFDSFTYNLVDQFRSLDFQVSIYRNDIDIDFLVAKLLAEPSILLLSPGPGAPHEAGNMMSIIDKAVGKVPILGICLGHQALVEHFGGKVGRSGEVMHGKSSAISHNQSQVFEGLPNPLNVARYHSLVAHTMPDCLDVSAQKDEMVMALQHKELPIIGFQFHPESILTPDGQTLLKNTINYLSKEA